MTCPVPGCKSLPDCKPAMCARCQDEDAGELAAKRTAGESRTAWELAKAEILRRRMPGQKLLPVAS